ncbi:alanine--tRNA ligase [Spiroplasma endosymbiont of Aspidapion aeneum]|uniref:alanine--tRNA ligase n=1 Tax=Spiroplasma endosymbiont of Aspidapion aeneum TaxID=3066276 RepID=UPI00313D812D
MKNLKANQVRKMWIDFFVKKGHYFLEPVSLVPNDDPSLLWINSGVATLKPFFEGREEPPHKNLTNYQKCIRTNDIDNVGITARHQTMFEMLGNFSIGGYFKNEAIHFAWELLTSEKWFGLDKEKLFITVFEEDKEAYDIWNKELNVPKERIFKGSSKTNFWDVGQGPCGPNTEIFFDRGEKYDPNKIGVKLLKDDIENDRYIEIWNIVFSQFNNDGKNNYTELPRKNIDTGAGFERLVSIFQDSPTNFDNDLFLPIIKEIEKLTGNKFKYDIQAFFSNDPYKLGINTSFKVISDHIRTIVFSISDGVYPSNKDRGYIIRRLIRRSMIHGRKIGIIGGFLSKLVDIVIFIMNEFYPNIINEKKNVIETIIIEENKFLETLNKGYNLIEEIIKKNNSVSAKECLLLFESFGFPIEITKELVDEKNKLIKDSNNKIKIDIKGFNNLLNKSKDLARKSRKDNSAWNPLSFILENLTVQSEFVGYDKEKEISKIVYMYKGELQIDHIKDNTCNVVLDKTPFFATKGGQENDTGYLVAKNGDIFNVIDVKEAKNGQYIHEIVVNGELRIGDEVEACINTDKRRLTMKNHSGTHLIHSAIKNVLGQNCNQIGSFNNDEGFRIDINYKGMPNDDQINKIEKLVNNNIKLNHIREIYYCDLNTAINKYKAISLFNEKYKEEVRVIKFGNFSSELCGGTHVEKTGDIERLVITKVESKGSGVIRFSAITSYETINKFINDKYNHFNLALKDIDNKFELLKNKINKYNLTKIDFSSMEEIISESKKSINERKNYKEIQMLENSMRIIYKKLDSAVNESIDLLLVNKYTNLEPIINNEYNLLNIEANDLNLKNAKILSDLLQNKYDDLILHIYNVKSKIYLVSIGKNLENKYSAIELFKKVNNFNLKGGGNKSLAQGKIV